MTYCHDHIIEYCKSGIYKSCNKAIVYYYNWFVGIIRKLINQNSLTIIC